MPSEDRAKRTIKKLLWVYIIMLLIEGGLRKWFVPFLSEPLLIARDPIVLLIYLVALQGGLFPRNGFVAVTIIMALMAFFFGLIAESSNLIVTVYGMRINFLQIPLIFVIGQALDYRDVVQIAKVMIILAVPQIAIMVLQFISPQGSFINRNVGGGEGIMGALGKFRPPGTFSFITGPAAYFPLVLAFVIGLMIHEGKKYTWLCAIGAVCAALAVPVSISRLLALSSAIVLLTAIYAYIRLPNPPKVLLRGMVVGAIVLLIVPLLPVFDDATEAFTERMVTSTGGEAGGVREEVAGRYFSGMITYPLKAMGEAPITGHGIGKGSNVGARLLTGERNFLLGESEWEKAILEMGPLLGFLFIIVRVAIVVFIFRYANSALSRGNAMPILIFSSCFLLILNGQWGPPMILGFAVLGGGLALAATKTSSVENEAQAST
ncbi:MAG: hypothetical protein AAGF10_00750 [Verrucomicrobiota bacterium]